MMQRTCAANSPCVVLRIVTLSQSLRSTLLKFSPVDKNPLDDLQGHSSLSLHIISFNYSKLFSHLPTMFCLLMPPLAFQCVLYICHLSQSTHRYRKSNEALLGCLRFVVASNCLFFFSRKCKYEPKRREATTVTLERVYLFYG